MQIYVGMVHHKHGMNTYAGRTEDEVNGQIAAYCREWWDQEFGSYKKLPGADRFVIAKYFDKMQGSESYEIAEVTLPDDKTQEPAGTPQKTTSNPTFRLRIWAEDLLVANQDYTVTAPTLEEAAQALDDLHRMALGNGYPVTDPAGLICRDLPGPHANDVFPLDPKDIVFNNYGVDLIEGGAVARHLIGIAHGPDDQHPLLAAMDNAVKRMIDLCTTHMTATDSSILSVRLRQEIRPESGPAGFPRVLEHERGFIVFCNSDEEFYAGHCDTMHSMGLSPEFVSIYRTACQMGDVILINFDSDGDEQKGLPIFDW